MKKNLKSRILALATCTLVLISSLMLPIGAEDVTETITTETPSYTSPIDWSAYPSANLLDVNTATIWTNSNKNNEYLKAERYRNGIKITALKNHTESWNRCGFTLGLTKDFLGKTFTLSVGQITYANPTEYSSPTIGAGICTHNNYHIGDQTNMISILTKQDKTLTFTVPTDANYTTYPYLRIYFYPSYGGTLNTDETVIYEDIMLNAGDVAYPFIPYMPYYFEQAFNNGYSEGNSFGFQEGCYSPEAEEYWGSYYFDIYYDIGHHDGKIEGYDEALGLYDCTWHTDTQNHPFYSDVYQNAYEYFKAKHPELLKRDLELMAQGAADWEFKEEIGFHYTCCANKNSYYLAGYEADIYLTGNSEGYETGYKEGHNTGKTTGYQEGLETAEKGTWENLIGAVVEAPVNAFQGLFNFEIMGLNMQAAFGSMLAICVLLIIVKKVVM